MKEIVNWLYHSRFVIRAFADVLFDVFPKLLKLAYYFVVECWGFCWRKIPKPSALPYKLYYLHHLYRKKNSCR